MQLNGWKRLVIALLGLWWLLWFLIYFTARSARDRAIAVDEADSGETWTVATWNPVVSEHQADMNQAMLAIAAPAVVVALVLAFRWVAKGFRKQS